MDVLTLLNNFSVFPPYEYKIEQAILASIFISAISALATSLPTYFVARKMRKSPARFKTIFLVCFLCFAAITAIPVLQSIAVNIEALQEDCGSPDYETSVSACTKIINSLSASNEDIQRALNVRSWEYYQAEHYQKAIEDTEYLTALDPETFNSYKDRAAIYELLNQNLKAADNYLLASERTDNEKDQTNFLSFAGILYHSVGIKDKAQTLLNKALTINPEAIQAFDMRHHILLKEGTYNQALQHLSKKLEKHPHDTGWLKASAITNIYLNNYDGAIEDIKNAVSLDLRNPYSILWLHLARLNKGDADLEDLATRAERFGVAKWPAPVLSLFLGKASVKNVLEKAKTETAITKKHNLCEANFFIGQHYLHHKNLAQAKDFFTKAYKNCPPEFVESSASAAELRRMKVSP